jgi:hypothetical protein
MLISQLPRGNSARECQRSVARDRTKDQSNEQEEQKDDGSNKERIQGKLDAHGFPSLEQRKKYRGREEK